jgi:hypothetical protein
MSAIMTIKRFIGSVPGAKILSGCPSFGQKPFCRPAFGGHNKNTF